MAGAVLPWLRQGPRVSIGSTELAVDWAVTAVLLWRMWLVGGSVLCPVPASPEGNGAQPGQAGRALAQGREEQSWADSTPTPGHTWGQGPRSILSLPAMWVALVPQPGSRSPPVMAGGARGCWCPSESNPAVGQAALQSGDREKVPLPACCQTLLTPDTHFLSHRTQLPRKQLHNENYSKGVKYLLSSKSLPAGSFS